MTRITFRIHPANPRFGFATVHFEDGTEYEEVMSAQLAEALIEERARLTAIETAAREVCAVLDEEADVQEPKGWVERLADRLHVAFAASGEGE